jgi:peptidyl-prolyl cis-trans isomerase SurA
MRRRGHRAQWLGATLAGWLLALTAMAASAEVLDRTIAVVNTHLVTWSDLDEEMRFEALENGRALKDVTEAERREAFDHLVQDWILRDQMQGTLPAADSDVDERIGELRAALHADAAAWAATLSGYGLSPDELHALVANQLEILRFLEFRVRPLVRVSRKEVDEYYTKTLVPQVKAQGQKPEPVEQVTAKIRELLAEQKMNEEMEKWLQTLRSQSQVRVLWDGVR